MVTKKKTTKKQVRPRTKVVYRTKTVYVKQKEHEDDDPFGNVNKMIGTGMGAVIGIGVAGAVVKSLKDI
jgi:hypothetical protein